jgi:hypothetical protein
MGVSSPNRTGPASKPRGAPLNYAGPAPDQKQHRAAARSKVFHLVLFSLYLSTGACMAVMGILMASGVRSYRLENAVMPVLSISLFLSVLGLLISKLFFRDE